MSLHLASAANARVSINSETKYRSPPSSPSINSPPDQEDSRGRRKARNQSITARTEDDSGEEKEFGDEDDSGKPRKRKRSRKGLDKSFACPHEGCGKSYSRAEHLYRHQLNHAPKQIYRCDFPGCERSFVRQDLRTRHRERHTAHGSHLQRKDNNAHVPENGSPPFAMLNVQRDHADTVLPLSGCQYPPNSLSASANGMSYTPAFDGHTSVPIRSPLAQRAQESYQSDSKSTIPVGKQFNPPELVENTANVHYGSNPASLKRSNSNDQPSLDNFGEYDSARMVRNVSISTYNSTQRHSSFGSYKTGRPQKGMYLDGRPSRSVTDVSTSPANYRPSPTSTYNGPPTHNGLAQLQTHNGLTNGSFAHHQNFPPLMALPPPVYPCMPQTSVQGPHAIYPSVSGSIPPVEHMANFDGYGSNGVNSNLVDPNGNPYPMPMFEGDSYSRSPYAMPDDFTAWLFNEPHLDNSSPGGHRHGSMSVGTSAFVDDFGGMSRNQYGANEDSMTSHAAPNIPQQHPMAVTSILDPTSLHTILSEERRKDVLEFIETHFTDHTPVKKQKEAILEGDRESDCHVLSLQSIQTYIGSYWYHFHPQMPILHKPTFSADKVHNLLLIAVIAIGASCLDKMHGPDVTQAGAELSNFLAWHLRGEIFKDVDFLPPAKLWVFQTLLLLEVYEKMYSTRILHERAHIHHGTTLTLMRRGSSLIGRSALDSPPIVNDGKVGVMSNGDQSASTSNSPEQWWNHWITNEATRRVAFGAFIIDSIHATMFGHSATMVAHEMKLALPCDESLWSASSSAEVARIESNLQAQGIKSMTFFDGLKNTLKGKPVQTNSFGRTAIMAGLLSVTWHMNQRDVQIHHLGALKALGGKDIWRGPLTKAFDSWKNNFDQSVGKENANASYPSARLDEENIFESRTVLHHLAHMAMHVDVVSCQIFAKAGRLLGRTTLPSDYDIAKKRIRSNWAPKASARHATFYALKFLAQVLLPDSPGVHRSQATSSMEPSSLYSARDDFLLNRPWVLYYAVLIVWSYGYALDGAIKSPPALLTVEQQSYDMNLFLTRVGGIQYPQELETMKDRNSCLGLLYVLREKFKKCRWELLHEAANLLGNCIDMLRGCG